MDRFKKHLELLEAGPKEAQHKEGDKVKVKGKTITLTKRNDRNGMVRWETAGGGFFYEGDED